MAPLLFNGWTIYAHHQLLDKIEELAAKDAKLRQKYPSEYQKKKSYKLLKTLIKRMLQEVPEDPSRAEYRQGDSLGDENRHWFRVKFFQQYRLFFQFREQEKIIVFGWVNDEETLRAYGSKTDAYLIFQKMLIQGNPPTDWDELLAEAKNASSRFQEIISRVT